LVNDLTPQQLVERLRGENPPLLVDVREEREFQFARIEGAELRPLSSVQAWMNELDKDREIALYCHSGSRSLSVAHYLSAHGFKNLINLRGGIDAWSREVDPTIPRY
jgi:rhodanese-related sulfurtransferase